MIGINLILENNPTVTQIDCGSSSPKLSGTINLSAFPNLQNFLCVNNGISGISGYVENSNLKTFEFSDNLVTSLPSLTGLIDLRDFRCGSNQITGVLPNVSGLQNLERFYCLNNRLSGTLQQFFIETGPTGLLDFRFTTNQISGNIPNLSEFQRLTTFLGGSNKLVGFASGSVSNTLGSFQVQNNQLSAEAVNAILAAFVAANRTAGTRILNLGGIGNAAPTGQGLTDKATLISSGWTVTTN